MEDLREIIAALKDNAYNFVIRKWMITRKKMNRRRLEIMKD